MVAVVDSRQPEALAVDPPVVAAPSRGVASSSPRPVIRLKASIDRTGTRLFSLGTASPEQTASREQEVVVAPPQVEHEPSLSRPREDSPEPPSTPERRATIGGEHWQLADESLRELSTATSFGDRTALLRSISDRINAPWLAEEQLRIDGGRGPSFEDSSNIAFATMVSVSRGALTNPAASGGARYRISATDPPAAGDYVEFRTKAIQRTGAIAIPHTNIRSMRDLERVGATLQEGQMAELVSRQDRITPDGRIVRVPLHSTVVAKLNGQLVNVNNQGWENLFGVPKGKLQTPTEWDQSFRDHLAKDGGAPSAVSYDLLMTSMRMPLQH